MKPPPQHTLPLVHWLHDAEHRQGFSWEAALGEDPLPWAERLFDCSQSNDLVSAQCLVEDMQSMADREYIEQFWRS